MMKKLSEPTKCAISSPTTMLELAGLPGAEVVEQGLRDLAQEQRSVEALLLAAATIRLRDLGLPVPEKPKIEEPELALYARLQGECDDPYYRYNALRRELASFISAYEARRRRQTPTAGAATNATRVSPETT